MSPQQKSLIGLLDDDTIIDVVDIGANPIEGDATPPYPTKGCWMRVVQGWSGSSLIRRHWQSSMRKKALMSFTYQMRSSMGLSMN